MKSRQGDLLGEVAAAPNSASGLIRIDRSRDKLTPAQRSFNRLSEQIERARSKLKQWEAGSERLLQRATEELLPAMQRLCLAQRELVDNLDVLLTSPPKGVRLGKHQRQAITVLLLELAEMVLQQEPDTAVEAIYDRHNDVTYQQEQIEAHERDLEVTEIMLGQVLGEQFLHDHQAQTAEELMRHAQQHLHEAQAQEREKKKADAPKRKPGSRQTAAERREQQAQAASQSVREIYRKLVSDLHPDRESDPDERARKTERMQQLTQAYRRNDLLTLLSMQIEMEHIDDAALTELTDERLHHYNRVLGEQLRALKQEAQDRISHLLQAMGADPFLQPRQPKDIDTLLDGQLREMQHALSDIHHILQAMADPNQRKQEIADIANSMRYRGRRDIDDFASL